MEDGGFIHQWPINSSDDMNTFGESLNHSFSHQMFDFKPSNFEASQTIDRPAKMLKTYNWNSSATFPPTQISFATQFENLKPKEEVVSPDSIITLASDVLASQVFGNQSCVFKASQAPKRVSTNNGFPGNQDHVMAERKRRAKLNHRFIDLSAMVPGLKKVTISKFSLGCV